MPVEASVAASFWPTSPALPIPVTITLPGRAIDQVRRPRDRHAEPVADPLQGLGLDPQHLAGEGQSLGLGLQASDASVIIAIVGLPAPVGNIPPPALPTGARTIAHPRRLVNAGCLNSRTLHRFID